MGILGRIDRFCEVFERTVVSYSILVMALVSICNVISRNLFQFSLTYAEEVSQFTIIWVTFIGTSYAARKGVHIRMSAIYDVLGQRTKKIMMLIMTAGTSFLMFVLCYYSYRYTTRIFISGSMSPALRFPMYLVIMWVPLGLGMTGIQYGIAFLKNLTRPEIFVSPSLIDGQEETDQFMV
ncbi:MAG: TRAP transporter small permease [Synergistales bacterium]|nr:TRAP transporter small permease [Synergistales bacterium]